VMVETSHFLITDLLGSVNTAATGDGSLDSLFAPLGSTLDNNLLDARVAYDASTVRFVLIAENFQPGGGNFATNIDIAVSKDSNPADGWNLASIATTLNGSTQSDMPYLSVSGGTIYLSGPEYLDAGGSAGTGEWVVNESSVAGSATIVPNASNTASSANGKMRNVAGANGVTFYVGANSNGAQTILGYQTYSTSGGFSAAQTIAVGNSDVGTGGNDYTTQQQGTSLTLGVGDSRIQSLAYANGYLWGVSEVKPSGASAPQILWFKLNVSNPAAPVLVLQGVISGAAIGTGVAVFNPSIAVDQNGDVLINFSASGPNMYPSDYYTVLGANASAFSAPTLYQPSNTYFNSGSLSDQRWGIYSTAVADPNNASGFWLSNEYVSIAVTGPGGSPGWWDTATAQLLVGGGGGAPPGPTVSSIVTSGPGITNGNGDLNAGKVVTLTVNFSSAVTVNITGGSPTLALNDGGTAIYSGGSGSAALTFSYTVAAGQNTPDLTVSSFNLNGATVSDAAANKANLAGATSYNPAGTLQIDTTAPTIAISTIASNNIINATKAAQGFAISGTTTGAENGQIVTVNIVNSTNTIVDTYTVADNNNSWSVSVTSAQAGALADGSYTVTANVSDKAGGPAPTATHALTVDEDKLPEVPALTIGNTSLTVQAGGSVALGITATPVDTDDRLSVKISGVPSYETITAPTGYSVTRQLQSNGTYTWTITESTSKTGTAITGLSLTSHYTGTGHPVANLTVTASNIASGETATSSSKTLAVTDPPAAPMAEFTSPGGGPLASSMPSSAYATLAALFAQHIAAGSGSDALGMSRMAWTAPPQLTGAFDQPTPFASPHYGVHLGA
jgi:hypothetical protein